MKHKYKLREEEKISTEDNDEVRLRKWMAIRRV